MPELSFGKLVIVLVVFLLIFGAKKLPEMGQGLGKGIREFKKSLSDTQDAINSPLHDDREPGPQRIMDRDKQPTGSATPPPPPSGGEPKRLSQ